MERVEEFKNKLKEDIEQWEEEIFRFACDLAWRLGKGILEELDNELRQQRDGGVKVAASNERCLTSIFGDVRPKK